MRLTEEDKQKIAKMRLDGKSYQQIATASGYSKSTVKSYLRRQGIKVLPPVDYEKLMYIYCLQCGARLQQNEKVKRKKFCCDACRMAWWKAHQDQLNRKTIMRSCSFCGKEFEANGSSPKKYCSTDRYFKDRFRDYTPKHISMSATQQLAEKNIRLCLMVVSALRAHGFMTAKDTVRAAKRLMKMYKPLTGLLLFNRFKQEVQDENNHEN